MHITAKITGIKYDNVLTSRLETFDFSDFNINKLPTSCLVNSGNFSFGLSKWVSPKRTRSYPYERVYNTLGCSKRITVIPIVKDEGKRGDRDFIQWDTVSLMSLLDVFVVFAYYKDAEKHKSRDNKITNQIFDNELVKEKISEIRKFHSSALHWNLKEIDESLSSYVQKAKASYESLAEKLNIELHSAKGIETFYNQFTDGVQDFMNTSRKKAKQAQNREMLTIQTKEVLATLTKASITVKNYLGGEYYFTTDEILIEDSNIYLIECKHSKSSLLPSRGDIKDGLLKIILYTNLEDTRIDGVQYRPIPMLKLTSETLKGVILSTDKQANINDFLSLNNISKTNRDFIRDLMLEANRNKFIVRIEGFCND